MSLRQYPPGDRCAVEIKRGGESTWMTSQMYAPGPHFCINLLKQFWVLCKVFVHFCLCVCRFVDRFCQCSRVGTMQDAVTRFHRCVVDGPVRRWLWSHLWALSTLGLELELVVWLRRPIVAEGTFSWKYLNFTSINPINFNAGKPLICIFPIDYTGVIKTSDKMKMKFSLSGWTDVI